MSALPVGAIAPVGVTGDGAGLLAPAAGPPASSQGFGQLLLDGIGKVDHKIASADALAAAFAVDDSIPVHQVTFALEQARLSLELMLQVRGRLVEGYQQIMGMQL